MHSTFSANRVDPASKARRVMAPATPPPANTHPANIHPIQAIEGVGGGRGGLGWVVVVMSGVWVCRRWVGWGGVGRGVHSVFVKAIRVRLRGCG